MKKHDIVYILKNDIKPDELKYSLRSVEKNFPHDRVFFFGGCPGGIKPDVYVPIEQVGKTKWEKVRNTLVEICRNPEVSDDFWLFNDDFFVMKKIQYLKPCISGSIARHVQRIREKHGKQTAYSTNLLTTARVLKTAGYDRLDYALHIPMLINKEKALEVLEMFPDVPMFRSLYGNIAQIGGEVTKDVKIQSLTKEPDTKSRFLSTSDNSFKDGLVGKYIREQFKSKSRFEKG